MGVASNASSGNIQPNIRFSSLGQTNATAHTSRTSRASVYRDKGDVLRLLATESLLPASRTGLLDFAESFEILTERVKVWNDALTAAGK
jgi:hypothetical protein